MTRNYGAGTRDMNQAGAYFAREAYDSYSSQATNAQRWNKFVTFVKERNNKLEQTEKVGRMERIDKETVHAYATHLVNRFERGEIVASTAQNYLSAVNRIIEKARNDKEAHVKGVKEAGLPQRSGIAKSNKSTSEEQHKTAQNQVSDRLGSQHETARTLGLRFEESVKLNAKVTLQEAKERGVITIKDGTKGGRTREIPVSERAMRALEQASRLQGDHHSMIPKGKSYVQYQKECYKEMAHTKINFHQERHSYANQRYNELTKCQSPVQGKRNQKQQIEYIAKKRGVSHAEAKKIDNRAKETLSTELGHNRVEVTRSYIG